MAQSAFTSTPMIPIPGSTEAINLTKALPQQIDPLYNTYDPIIVKGLAAEKLQDARKPSKLEAKMTSITDKIKTKKDNIGYESPEEKTFLSNTLAAAKAGTYSLFGKGAELLGEGIETIGDVTGIETLSKEGAQIQQEQQQFRQQGLWNKLAEFDDTGVQQIGKDFQQAFEKDDYVGMADAIFRPEAITAFANSLPEMIAMMNPWGLGAVMATNVNKNLNDLGPNATAEQKAISTGLSVVGTALDRLGDKVVLGGGEKALQGIISKMTPAAQKAIQQRFGNTLLGLGIKVGAVAPKAGFEGLTEGIQTTLEGKATDIEKMNFELTPEERKEALQATGVGIAAGGVPSGAAAVPSAVKLTTAPLNAYGKRAVEKRTQRKNLEAARAYVTAGYKDEASMNKHKDSLEKDLATQEASISKLSTADKDITKILKSDATDFVKIQEIQKVMDNGYRPNEANSLRIFNIGKPELDKVLSLLDNKEFTKSVNGLDAPALTKYSAVINHLAQNKDALTPEVRTELNNLQASLKDQVSTAVKSSDIVISYSNSLKQLKDENKITATVKKELDQLKAPKTTKDITARDLINLSQEEMKKKLAGYDNLTVTKLMKEARQLTTEQRRADRELLASDQLGALEKAVTGVKNAVQAKPSQVVSKTADKLLRQRKLAKRAYDPTKSIGERVNTFIGDMMDEIRNAAKSPSAKQAQKYKDSATAVVSAVQNLDKIKDIPIVEEAISHLETIGSLAKSRADSLRKKIKEYKDSLDTIDTTNVRENVKKTYEDIVTKAKTMTKEDLVKEVDTLTNKLKARLTPTEKAFVASTLAKLSKAGNVSTEYVKSKVDELSNNDKTVKEQLQQAVDKVAKVVKDREVYEKKATELVSKIKDSKLAKEVSKDFKQLFDNTMTKLGEINIKESFDKISSKVTDADYAGMYQSMKELGSLDKVKHKVNKVDEIVDENGKPLIEDEVCK